ncbi:MAG: valine--tRNA ligase [Candidatus Peregrinibacteria bacterium]
MLEKTYEAKKYEDKIYKKWEESGAFKAKAGSRKKPFTISMPPPNATGVLHLGHAVMLALEDILTRHRRMKGHEALWLPGTDHAAIATENVVIRLLQKEEGIKDPRSLGRKKLVARIAEHVEKSRGTIRSQIRKMGASCDWSRERYTLDPSLNRCVNEMFKRMYDDGLIYRRKRVVNWDVTLQTTISDDEVEHTETEATLYTFEYVGAEQTGGKPIYVATSRPETKLGDTALAVHPDDKRYQHLIGKNFDVIWPGGQAINVTVIADHSIDPTFGTGVLGVTPFHSKIDYDMWQRHQDEIRAEPIQVIDEQGKIAPEIEGYAGMTVEGARDKFVQGLREQGRLTGEVPYLQPLSISYRSKKPVEPLPKLQWFIDVNKRVVGWKGKKMSLKEVMQDVVHTQDIRIIPDRFEKIYFHWIDNLQDWCVSRQIWWGHRVPAWYRGKEIAVSTGTPEGKGWQQDSDTLDTWFSSALWTWSTLVDPTLTDDLSLSLDEILKRSPDFNKFHPTQVMETGYDILFFWVARMILMTTYATGQIPFDTVYLHGLIRTREGKKMSKSDPSTCIDPLDMIEKYGADALRMSMVMGNTPGNDMRLYEEKIKGYRNFTNKLWNVSRFVLGILKEKKIKDVPALDGDKLSDADRWILGKLSTVAKKADQGLTDYQIRMAGEALYEFLWSDFCDWYLELSKGDKQNPAVLYYVLKNILILLHPFVPFVTEAIWKHLPGQTEMLIGAPYPNDLHWEAEAEAVERIIEAVTTIRRLRAENKIEPAKTIAATLYGHEHLEVLKRGKDDIKRLARLSRLTLSEKGKKLPNAAADVVSGMEIFVPLKGLVDVTQEKARLSKEIENLEGYIDNLSNKLANANFAKNAPKAIVTREQERLAESRVKLEKLKAQLQHFS